MRALPGVIASLLMAGTAPSHAQPGGDAASAPVVVASPAPTGHGPRSAWLLIGGSIGFITIGAVLAYSATSSEADIADLYLGLGRTPTYDMKTQANYEELIAQGERYQYLSWAAFGVAGAAAIGAAFLFATHEPTVRIAPSVSSQGGGVAALIKF